MKRPIKTFEAEPDVERMIDRADKDGIRLKHICNRAIRKHLTSLGYARKKDLAVQEKAVVA